MSDQSAEVLALTAAAEQVRQELNLAGFGSEEIAHLNRVIDAQRSRLTLAEREGFLTGLGCYLGECLVRTYHGDWAAGPDGTTGVGIAGKLFFNPFYLVKEHLDKGATASVASFFASVPWRVAGRAAAQKE
ncbi:MAG: hypothetical protein EOO36_05890 [Cytophagaceae bacterium]|nr:MAG: hypothetical protein EOO36_05890 [Cytophagaceae bacterium]